MKIERTHQFEKNFKKYVTTTSARKNFAVITKLLESEEYDVLEKQYDDHQLNHQAKGIRDVHIADDLVTVYYRIIDETITMLDVGPHSKIFRHHRRF